jgi:hypothetical protein
MSLLQDLYNAFLESGEDWDVKIPITKSRKGLEDLFTDHDVVMVDYDNES